MSVQVGPLLSAVQQALARPGVRQTTSGGQWRIEFTEEALLAWLAEQHTRIRRDTERSLTEPAADGDKQSPYTEEEAAYARSVLRRCLVQARSAGALDIGVSELQRHISDQGIERGRTWIFTNLTRLREQGLVRHNKKQKRWSLLPELDTLEG